MNLHAFIQYTFMRVEIRVLAVLLLLAISCQCITYSMDIPTNERVCFYEVFEANQKYSFVVYSKDKFNYQIEVAHIDGRQWKTVYFKNQHDRPRARVDKIASVATTYSFCLKSNEPTTSTYKISFNSGIEVMELNELPDDGDAQNLDRELKWLENQGNVLSERATNIQGLRLINQQIAGMVGTKMLVFGVIGLIAIAAVNVIFFKSLKKTFKDRKLI